MNLENSHRELIEFLDAHHEWLLVEIATGKSFAVSRDEMELDFEHEKLLFSFLDEKGFQTWRVRNWKIEKGKIHFYLTRNFGKENKKIQLVSRVSSAELAENIELARIEKANQIANLIAENFPKGKLVRVNLNKESGRFAQIIFEISPKKQIAALADVSGESATSPEKFLTGAIFWLEKLQSRKKNSVETVWILAEKKTARDLEKLHALLRENFRASIEIFEIAADESGELKLKNRKMLFEDLWREKPKRIKAVAKNWELSETARKIVEFAPAEIDVVSSRHGETLRFLGLPFARVRKIFGVEKAWFGIEKKRQILNEKTFEEFLRLIENLKIYRRANSPNKRHSFYFSSPESWLEAILRKNVKLLDANLILSPLHQQFRVSGDKIDLLALRRDGRLVVVELKTSADREMIFQAADYWRKIELLRRAGILQKLKIFGDAEILDAPPLVYLVAPALSFHRDLNFLAQWLAPQIEMIRFCLNENWRENLRVLDRNEI